MVGGIATVDKDSASEREKLQKDLQNTKSALEDIKKEETVVTSQESASSVKLSGDEQVCIKYFIRANSEIAIFLCVVTFSRNVFQKSWQPEGYTQWDDGYEWE